MKQKKWIAALLSFFLILCACSSRTQPPGPSEAAVSSFAPVSSAQQEQSSASSAASSVVSSEVSSAASSAASSFAQSSALSSKPSAATTTPPSKVPAKTPASAKPAAPSKTPANSPSPSPPTQQPMAPVTAKMPSAPGSAVFAEAGAQLDYSNASQGYVMAKYSGGSKIKVLVYFNGGSNYYQYNIASDGAYDTIPLQSGSGAYRIRFMENVGGSSYAELCATEISASCGTNYTYYPNQYVSYTRSSSAVATAKSLCASASSNSEKVQAIYQYICANIKYDYAKASSVSSGYLPNVDSTLSSKKGICFDYAALMTAMLRSQNIPTKLIIGNTSKGYHAWNEVNVGGWKRYDSTFGAMGQTAGTYTPQRYY